MGSLCVFKACEARSSYLPNQKANFKVILGNPSSKYEFTNVQVTVKGLLDLQKQVPRLKINEELTIIESEFITPNKTGKFNITTTYITIYKQRLTSRKSVDINIKKEEPIEETVEETANETQPTITTPEPIQEETLPEKQVITLPPVKEPKKQQGTPIIVMIIIISFLIIDFFLAVSIYKKKKKE